jgi:chemotaxis protein histidine kinase CheA
MTMSDAIAEARRVLAKLKGSKGWVNVHIADELSEALNNLLSHVERLTAPVTGDRAEAIKWLRHIRNEWPDKIAALLEADARREAALAEAVREIEDLFTRPVTYGGRPWPDGEWLQEHLLAGVLAILAKVSAGRPDSGAGSSLEDWVRDVAAGRPDGGER